MYESAPLGNISKQNCGLPQGTLSHSGLPNFVLKHDERAGKPRANGRMATTNQKSIWQPVKKFNKGASTSKQHILGTSEPLHSHPLTQ